MKAHNRPDSPTGSDSNDKRIPLIILSGFLGAGKTTVLNHLLQNANGRRIAVLVNDVGEVNIDAALVKDVAQVDSGSADNVLELNNGCICCGIKEAFNEAIINLANRKPDCIIVEATGIAEPHRIISSLTTPNEEGVSVENFVRISNLVTVIDAQWWIKKVQETYQPIRRSQLLLSDPRRPLSELLTLQVESASVIILNKTDLADEASLKRSQSALAALTPSAEIIATQEGQIEIEQLLDNERFNPATAFKSSRCDLEIAKEYRSTTTDQSPAAPSHDHGDFGLTVFVYRSREPISHDKLIAYLRSSIPGLLRAKGFAWTDREPDNAGFLSLAGDSLRFDYLSKWMHAQIKEGTKDRSQIPPEVWQKWDRKTGDRRQEIVFIGIDLNRQAIESRLKSFHLSSPQ